MWNAVRAIAQKDIYTVFTDRSLLLIMFVTPLILSTIIGLAFGGIGGAGGDLPVTNLALVNQDEGAELNGTQLKYGDIFVNVFAPSADASLPTGSACKLLTPDPNNASADTGTFDITKLIKTTRYDTPEAARAAVDAGEQQVALIIPSDLTQTLQISAVSTSLGQTQVEIYGSPAYPVSVSIVQSIAGSISSQIANGSVTIAATIQALIQRAQNDPIFGLRWTTEQATGAFQPDFGCGFIPDLSIVSIQREALNAAQTQSAFAQILIAIGSGQAVFFALFTAQFGLLSIYDEQKQGTLARIMAAPVPRSSILVGKLVGNFFSVLLQVLILLMALTVIVSVVEGQPQFIWGSNLPLVVLTTVVIAISVAGVGVFIVGIARTAEQARIMGPIVNSTLAALGGVFGFSLPLFVSQFSPIYWATNAFSKLAQGNPDIGLNLIVLLVQGSLMFIIGTWLFSRRIDI